MEVAIYTVDAADMVYTDDTVDTVLTFRTAFHCICLCMPVYILIGKIRTLLECAGTQVSKKLEWVSG